MMRWRQLHLRVVVPVLFALSTSTSRLHAQADARELDTATEILRECASMLEKRCFYPLNAATVLSKALSELHKAGGAPGADAPPPPDLTQLSEAEAIQTTRAHLSALTALPGQRLSALELAEAALEAYCRTIDPYTRYSTAEDAARLDKARTIQGSGIGMTLQEKDGFFYCYPFPESSAALAGIRPGDKLLTVDGRPLQGKSINLIGTWIKGAPGTPVNLRLEKGGTGRAQLLAVTREAAVAQPIYKIERDSGGVVIRLRRFEPGLAEKIREELAAQPSIRLLTLDLRGNQGGNARAAIEVAQLFLESGKKILTILERGMKPLDFTSENASPFRPTQISILQDEGTASAAEIVIAALAENLPGKAASQGEKSYGKGVVQDEVALSSGGKLIVTVGMMFGPGGLSWNETGLLSSTTADGKIYSDRAISITKPTAGPKPVVKLVD